MNKKEINEIRALFNSVENAGIERLCGCYVDGEKNIISTFSRTFLNIEEDEMHKYLEIFRKSLSGIQGKNLIDMDFTLGTDGNRLLESMRASGLKDDNLNSLFFDKIIETYDYVGSYLILVICQAYDVPGVTDDGIKMDDASEEVYNYILCSICPVGVTKPGLGYFEETNEFHTLIQNKFVDMPVDAFLYPAFNDRSADTGSILYYSQKGEGAHEKFLGDFLGVSSPLPAVQQKEIFDDMIRDAIPEDSDMEFVAAVHENLAEMVSEKKKQTTPGTPVAVGKQDVSRALRRSGFDDAQVNSFEQRYDEEFGYGDNSEIYAANIMPARSKLEVKTPDVVIKINYDKTDLVKTQIIDGKKCLVIELGEGLVVNGIPVQ